MIVVQKRVVIITVPIIGYVHGNAGRRKIKVVDEGGGVEAQRWYIDGKRGVLSVTLSDMV